MVAFAVHVSRQSTSSIQLSWPEIVGISVYKVVELRLYGGCELKVSYWGTAPSCKITGLESNYCYAFRVKALRQVDGGDFEVQSASDIVKANTLPPPPNAMSLHRATRNSQEYLIKRYLATRIELLAVPGPSGLLPLCSAVQSGNKDLVDIMLRFGADVNAACPISGRTALQLALFHGHVAIAKAVAERKAELMLRDCVGLTAAEYALDGGFEMAVRLMLELFADLLNDESSWPSLNSLLMHAATMRCSVAIVSIILNHARVEKIRIDWRAAQQFANDSGQLELMELFEAFDGEFNQKESSGLDEAVQNIRESVIEPVGSDRLPQSNETSSPT